MTGRLARDESVERRRYPWRWSRLGIALAIGGVGFFALQRVDLPLGHWGARFASLKHDSTGDQVMEGFKNFAQPVTVVTAIALAACLDKRRKRIIIAVLIAQAGALVTYNAGKLTIGRDRPEVALQRLVESDARDAGGTWRGWRIGNTSRDYQSFPSGHSAAAFALAGVLAWYFPRAAGVFWILAAGCMVSRVLVSAHWPSDCCVGAVIGYVWAQIGLRFGR